MERLDSFAKKLRREATDTERLLWSRLRAKRFLELKWRRQEAIGRYIVDFVCYERRIIIECDGGQHASQNQRDQERDRWFENQGYRVLRFWDTDILKNTEGVLETILQACQSSPSPSSPPIPGGEIK